MTIKRIRPYKTTVTNGSYTVNYNGKNTISRKSLNDMEKQIDQFLDQYNELSRRFDDPRSYTGNVSSQGYDDDFYYTPPSPPDTPGGGVYTPITSEEEGCFFTCSLKKVDPSTDASTAFYNFSSLPGDTIIALSNHPNFLPRSTMVDITEASGTFGNLWIDSLYYCVGIGLTPEGTYADYTCSTGPQNGQFGWEYDINNIVGGPFLSGVCDDQTNTNCGVTIVNGEEVPNHPYGYCAGFDPLENGVYLVTAVGNQRYTLDGQTIVPRPKLPITYPGLSIEPYLIIVVDGTIRWKIPFNSRDYGDIYCAYWDSLEQTCKVNSYIIKVAHQLLVGFVTSPSWLDGGNDNYERQTTANITYEMDQAIQAATGFTAKNLADSIGACDDYCFYPFSNITYETSPTRQLADLCGPPCWPLSMGASLQSCQETVSYLRFNNINPDTQCYEYVGDGTFGRVYGT